MRLIALCVLFLSASLAHAQGLFGTARALEESRAWEAVGRLEIAGTTFCTGALVAPHLVLTAAHCLYEPETGARVPESDIQFLAGWRNGRPAAYRRVLDAVPHPAYDPAGPPGPDRVRRDLALIELQHPIDSDSITPFATGTPPEAGTQVGVVAYAHDRSQAPALEDTCTVMAREANMLVLSCPVQFGASGAPVFAFGPDGVPRIVSVISAKAEADGQPVALASGLLRPLDELRDLVPARETSRTADLQGRPASAKP